MRTPDDYEVSSPLYEFFQVEIRNEAHGGSSPSTLGTAYESLVQAPLEVINDWMRLDGLAYNPPVPYLVEFGQMLERFGEDQQLREFYAD